MIDDEPAPKRRPSNRPKGKGPGHGGPAKGSGAGPGWGGPPRTPNPNASKTITPGVKGNNFASLAKFDTETAMSVRHDRAAKKELRLKRAGEMEDVIYSIASNELADDNVRITAATKLHSIYEGTPVQRIITQEVDDAASLSEADLDAELAKYEGATLNTIEGEAPQELPKKS